MNDRAATGGSVIHVFVESSIPSRKLQDGIDDFLFVLLLYNTCAS
ncbi:MAG: hypothetical protein ABI663_09330 [Chryseolinea sp.]